MRLVIASFRAKVFEVNQSLAGKVVIITGASSGIGAAAARLFAQHGCKLALAARSADKLEALATELQTETLVVPTDMTVPAEIAAMVERTQAQFGSIDVMFANAGVFIYGDFISNDPDVISNLLRVNVDAVLRCVHAVIPIMKAQGGGDILVTSSISGHVKFLAGPEYGASKHAIETFVNTLQRQLSPDGIRVGALAPGRTANALWGFSDAKEIERQTVGEHAYVKVEDVAEAALFMLSRPPHVTIRNLVMMPQNQDA
jgi:ribitol 2-dehydrogenase